MSGLAARGAGISETGRVRETNQDRILLLDRLAGGRALYAIADGLGGHAAGGVASTLAVDTLVHEVPSLLEKHMPPLEALAFGVRCANAAIYARAAAPDEAGMATTCTAVLIADRSAAVAHVGDSRAYLVRGTQIRQLTTDHSVVAELVRQGRVSPAEAGGHAQRHVLTRALGTAPEVQIDVFTVPLAAGDTLVLASDGVHTAMTREELANTVLTSRDADEGCRALVGLANARGGTDNASAVIVRLRPRWRDIFVRIAAPVAVAAFIAAGAGAYRLEHVYFLGVAGGHVAVMRGVPGSVLGVPLFTIVRTTPVAVAQIAPAYRERLSQGIPARDPGDAEALLQDLLRRP